MHDLATLGLGVVECLQRVACYIDVGIVKQHDSRAETSALISAVVAVAHERAVAFWSIIFWDGDADGATVAVSSGHVGLFVALFLPRLNSCLDSDRIQGRVRLALRIFICHSGFVSARHSTLSHDAFSSLSYCTLDLKAQAESRFGIQCCPCQVSLVMDTTSGCLSPLRTRAPP